MSEMGPGCVKTHDAELARRKFVSITLNKKRTALAVTVERRKERKQFCAFSARARFHTAWVISGLCLTQMRCPLFPQKRTSSDTTAMSVLCQQRKSRLVDHLVPTGEHP